MKIAPGAPWRTSNMASMSEQLKQRTVYLQQEIGSLVKKAIEEPAGGFSNAILSTKGVERECLNIAALSLMILDICLEGDREIERAQKR